RSAGQVTHVLLTRSPLEYPRKGLSVRLACVKHAASVRPEPGSNSPQKLFSEKPKPSKIRTTSNTTNPKTSCVYIICPKNSAPPPDGVKKWDAQKIRLMFQQPPLGAAGII